MNTRRLALLLALPCALVACKKDDTAAAGAGADTIPLATTPPPDSLAGATAVVVANAGPSTLAMSPVGGSGVMGQTSLVPGDSGISVTVDLSGLKPGPHAGMIHAGNCDAPGAVVETLPDVVAGADGKGKATTTVKQQPGAIMDGQHVVAYHAKAGADHGGTVVCGLIAKTAS
jgi:hypothetical protein